MEIYRGMDGLDREGRRKKEEGRRKRNAIKSMVSAIENVHYTLAIAICLD